MLRLLDGHPQLHVVPHEFGTRLGDSPELLEDGWNLMRDRKLERLASSGYHQSKRRLNGELRNYPFVFDLELAERLYRKQPIATEREAVDAYFTSYFSAWGNNRNLDGEKHWVVAFKPNLLNQAARMRRMFELYPDGRLISLVRDPFTWWVSAREWREEWKNVETAIRFWVTSARSALKWDRVLGDRAKLIAFDDLLRRPKHTTRSIAVWLDIEPASSLLTPTVNGAPIKGNSSHADASEAVSTAPLERAAILTGAERTKVEELAGETWQMLSERIA